MKKAPPHDSLIKSGVTLMGDENMVTIEVRTRALLLPTKCLRNGGVQCKFNVLSSFNVWSRGDNEVFQIPTTAQTQTLGARR